MTFMVQVLHKMTRFLIILRLRSDDFKKKKTHCPSLEKHIIEHQLKTLFLLNRNINGNCHRIRDTKRLQTSRNHRLDISMPLPKYPVLSAPTHNFCVALISFVYILDNKPGAINVN